MFIVTVTRGKRREIKNNGFDAVPKVLIRRITTLDQIILNRKVVVTRRRTVGCPVTPKPVPLLIPLRSVLKRPAQVPFNIRGRKSMFPSITYATSTPKRTLTPIHLPKGTVARMVLARATQSSPQPSPVRSASPQPGPSHIMEANPDVNETTMSSISSPDSASGYGQLRYSESDD